MELYAHWSKHVLCKCFRPSILVSQREKSQKRKEWIYGDAGYRSPCLSHAKRALFHLSYTPLLHDSGHDKNWFVNGESLPFIMSFHLFTAGQICRAVNLLVSDRQACYIIRYFSDSKRQYYHQDALEFLMCLPGLTQHRLICWTAIECRLWLCGWVKSRCIEFQASHSVSRAIYWLACIGQTCHWPDLQFNKVTFFLFQVRRATEIESLRTRPLRAMRWLTDFNVCVIPVRFSDWQAQCKSQYWAVRPRGV